MFGYLCVTRLYFLLIHISALWNPKAKKWVQGRKNLLEHIRHALKNERAPRMWIHCASYGEVEQARAFMRAYKSSFPEQRIVLTVFSSSGFVPIAEADYLFYLPQESKYHAAQMLELIHPVRAIFVKYEFWHFYLKALYDAKIPTILISALFRKNQLFFRWYGGFYRNMLHYFQLIFVQNEESKALLENIKISPVFVAGDTRFDRVLQIKEKRKRLEQLDIAREKSKEKHWIVAGSTWFKDEQMLSQVAQAIHLDLVWIIVPHEVDASSIQKARAAFPRALLFSEWLIHPLPFNSMIVDRIGYLASLYAYADLAYVGGAFDKEGVHNVLEPAVYGLPVIFGPQYSNYTEALDLIEKKIGFSVNHAHDMTMKLEALIKDPSNRKTIAHATQLYFEQKRGASRRILQALK